MKKLKKASRYISLGKDACGSKSKRTIAFISLLSVAAMRVYDAANKMKIFMSSAVMMSGKVSKEMKDTDMSFKDAPISGFFHKVSILVSGQFNWFHQKKRYASETKEKRDSRFYGNSCIVRASKLNMLIEEYREMKTCLKNMDMISGSDLEYKKISSLLK